MKLEADDMATRLHAEFPGALRSGQVVGYYQPEVELSTGRLVAAELLARWEHPELGSLPPDLFIPLAEQLGLMGELSRLMLRQALAQHRAWAADGWVVPVSVNVGPSCVADPALPATVTRLLREEQVPGQMLTLEVSEETGATCASAAFFAQLAESGVRVSLDDFGTGFASLESLGGWPIDELKLDRSIVRPIVSSSSFRAIVRTTIDLAHQLGVRVVAEGIESEAISTELRALKCDSGQGLYLGRPMPAAAFTEWMRDLARLAPQFVGSAYPLASPPRELHAVGLVSAAVCRTARAMQRAVEPIGVRALTIAVALMVVYGLWQVFRWGGREHQALIGDLAFIPVSVTGTVLAWRASRRADLGRDACRALRLLAIALALYLIGDVLQLGYEVGMRRRASPSWADVPYLAFYPVAFSAILAFPGRRRSRPEWLRLLLDMGIVFTGGAMLIWYAALGPAIAAAGPFDLLDLIAYAYPVGDLLLLFGTLAVLLRGPSQSSNVTLRIFAVGMLAYIAADLTNAHVTAYYDYLGGDPVDTLWILALVIVCLAATTQVRIRPVGAAAAVARPASARLPFLPYLVIAGSYMLLALIGLRSVGFDSLGGGLLAGAVTLTCLVSARQYIALHDYGRLAVRYQELASVDGITGLYNRRHFMEAADAAVAGSQPLVALMIDVDNFKQINDTHGHIAGDQVLAEMAQACREQVRPDDIVGRYGGDEFIIIVTGITSLRATQIAGQLARRTARVLGHDGKPLAYSASIGIAGHRPGDDLPALLMQADEAMYEAKRAGGGSWRIYSDEADSAQASSGRLASGQ